MTTLKYVRRGFCPRHPQIRQKPKCKLCHIQDSETPCCERCGLKQVVPSCCCCDSPGNPFGRCNQPGCFGFYLRCSLCQHRLNGGDLLKPTEWWAMIHPCQDSSKQTEQDGQEATAQLGMNTIPRLRLIRRKGDTQVMSLSLPRTEPPTSQ